MENGQQEGRLPNWLKNLQENSWELELLISGGAIFSLFQLSDFYIDWIQSIRVTNHVPGAGLVMIVGMIGLKVLTLGFSLHLILRGYWLSLICINYVFPEGIREERLAWKKPFQFINTGSKDLREQIVRVDKNCGLVMYMSIISAFALFGLIVITVFSVLLALLIEIVWGSDIAESSYGVTINLMLIYILDLISFGLLRRIPLLSYITYLPFKFYDFLSFRPVYQKSLSLFSTNIKKWRFVMGAIVFSVIAILNAYSSLYKVQHWPNVLDDRDYRWQRAKLSAEYDFMYSTVADLHYMDNWEDGKSRPFGLGSKVVSGNYQEVYVRYDKVNDVLIEATAVEFENRYFSEIIEVRIDGITQDLRWYSASKTNFDIGVTAMMDLSDFENGEHLVTITVKDEYSHLHDEHVNRPKQVVVPFWIDRISISIPDSTEKQE